MWSVQNCSLNSITGELYYYKLSFMWRGLYLGVALSSVCWIISIYSGNKQLTLRIFSLQLFEGHS